MNDSTVKRRRLEERAVAIEDELKHAGALSSADILYSNLLQTENKLDAALYRANIQNDLNDLVENINVKNYYFKKKRMKKKLYFF